MGRLVTCRRRSQRRDSHPRLREGDTDSITDFVARKGRVDFHGTLSKSARLIRARFRSAIGFFATTVYGECPRRSRAVGSPPSTDGSWRDV